MYTTKLEIILTYLFQSTHDGEHMEPGELVPPDVDPEFKPEADHVLPETLVELDAQDHQLNHEPVEWPLVSEKYSESLRRKFTIGESDFQAHKIIFS